MIVYKLIGRENIWPTISVFPNQYGVRPEVHGIFWCAAEFFEKLYARTRNGKLLSDWQPASLLERSNQSEFSRLLPSPFLSVLHLLGWGQYEGSLELKMYCGRKKGWEPLQFDINCCHLGDYLPKCLKEKYNFRQLMGILKIFCQCIVYGSSTLIPCNIVILICFVSGHILFV